MKKILKILLLLLVFIVLTGLLLNYGFKLIESYKGKKFVTYWKNNPAFYEQKQQEASFSFKLMNQIIQDNDLILFGESHGTQQAQKIDLQLIKHLYKKVNMKNNIVELDFSQAFLINQYLKTGNKQLIEEALKNWVVISGRNNVDYYNKWKELYHFNQKLGDSEKINIIGIDKIQDFELAQKHISNIFKENNINEAIPKTKDSLINWAKDKFLSIVKSNPKIEKEKLQDLLFIHKNLINYQNTKRSEMLFSNFKEQYQRFRLEGKKIYGYFGLAHVLQKEINNYDDFGALIKKSKLPLKDKTFTIITLIVDSYMGIPSEFLPKPLREESKITKIPYTFDKPLIMYFYGINDLKKITNENTNTLFVLNNAESPYKKTLRLIDNISLMPIFGDGITISDKQSAIVDYTQGILLIRNSDWAQPNIELLTR
jgi:hypothetical protein